MYSTPVYRLLTLLALFILASCQGERIAPPAKVGTTQAPGYGVVHDPNQVFTLAPGKSVDDEWVNGESSRAGAPGKSLNLELPQEDTIHADLVLEEKAKLPDLFDSPQKQGSTEFKSKLLMNEQEFEPGKPHKSVEMIDGAEVTIEKKL
jgi:hypothetical protein